MSAAMLRIAVLGVGVGLLGLALHLHGTGNPGAVPAAIWGALLVAAVCFERWRYRPGAAAGPSARWQKTPERFVDPETGRTMQVWFDPRSGDRRYEPADDAGGDPPSRP